MMAIDYIYRFIGNSKNIPEKMTEIKKFKYDVAFSFCQEDEYIALEINEFLSSSLNVFIYSKKQNQLVGTDGEIEFKKTFSELSRVVVILYRKKYGTTSWTRMEEEAIRGRAYEESYDFSLFIPLDKDKTVPIYLPKTRIWYDLERFGPQTAANIISFVINERGGSSHLMTSEEKAERFKNKLNFDNKIKTYLLTNQAFEDSTSEMTDLIESGKLKADMTFNGLNFEISTNQNRLLQIKFERYLLHFEWCFSSVNKIDDAYLEVSKYKYYEPDDPFEKGEYEKITTINYLFNKNLNWENVWKIENKNEYLKTDMVIEKHFFDFFDYIEKQKFDENRNIDSMWA